MVQELTGHAVELATLERELLVLASSLTNDATANAAAPFLSGCIDNHRPSNVLLIGKATAGDWYADRYVPASSVEERRRCTVEFLDIVATGGYHSSFWTFAKALSAAVSSSPVTPLSRLVWSNLVKVGVKTGNPEREAYVRQAELSARLIRAEILHYSPKVVVFVTGNYGREIIAGAIGADPITWTKLGIDALWRASENGWPPMLLIPHPQGKSRERLTLWTDAARNLARTNTAGAPSM